MPISDWSSDVCASDLDPRAPVLEGDAPPVRRVRRGRAGCDQNVGLGTSVEDKLTARWRRVIGCDGSDIHATVFGDAGASVMKPCRITGRDGERHAFASEGQSSAAAQTGAAALDDRLAAPVSHVQPQVIPNSSVSLRARWA